MLHNILLFAFLFVTPFASAMHSESSGFASAAAAAEAAAAASSSSSSKPDFSTSDRQYQHQQQSTRGNQNYSTESVGQVFTGASNVHNYNFGAHTYSKGGDKEKEKDAISHEAELQARLKFETQQLWLEMQSDPEARARMEKFHLDQAETELYVKDFMRREQMKAELRQENVNQKQTLLNQEAQMMAVARTTQERESIRLANSEAGKAYARQKAQADAETRFAQQREMTRIATSEEGRADMQAMARAEAEVKQFLMQLSTTPQAQEQNRQFMVANFLAKAAAEVAVAKYMQENDPQLTWQGIKHQAKVVGVKLILGAVASAAVTAGRAGMIFIGNRLWQVYLNSSWGEETREEEEFKFQLLQAKSQYDKHCKDKSAAQQALLVDTQILKEQRENLADLAQKVKAEQDPEKKKDLEKLYETLNLQYLAALSNHGKNISVNTSFSPQLAPLRMALQRNAQSQNSANAQSEKQKQEGLQQFLAKLQEQKKSPPNQPAAIPVSAAG